MKKHNIFIIGLLSFFLSLSGVSQKNSSKIINDKLKEAHFYYSVDNFSYALGVFKELYNLDSTNYEICFKLGRCIYYTNRNKTEALEYFEKCKHIYIEAYYYLGNIYHLKMYFDKALECFNYYRNYNDKKNISPSGIDYLMDKCIVAKQMINKPENVKINNLGDSINSEYPDYVPLINADETILYFTSRRSGGFSEAKDVNGEYYEDIYMVKKNGNDWGKVQNVGAPLNSTLHDACVTLSHDGTEMYIFRTNTERTGGDIYVSKLVDGKWSEPIKFEADINSKGAISTSITIAPDMNTIYFSSNREGGYGGKDIYVLRKLPNGMWSIGGNLGPVINSPYDEDAPFIHPDGKTLYFSSKGHKNMGGYDIFKSTLLDDGTWSAPENLGYPINTVFDDIFFVVSANGKRAYYSSQNNDTRGFSDIYSIDLPDNKSNQVLLRGTISTNDPVFKKLEATITIIDNQTKEVQGIYKTNKTTGKYIMVLLPRKKYKMFVEAPNYYTYIDTIDLTQRLRMEDLFKNITLKWIEPTEKIMAPKYESDTLKNDSLFNKNITQPIPIEEFNNNNDKLSPTNKNQEQRQLNDGLYRKPE